MTRVRFVSLRSVILLRAHHLHPATSPLRVDLLVDLFDDVLDLRVPTATHTRTGFLLDAHLDALHV